MTAKNIAPDFQVKFWIEDIPVIGCHHCGAKGCAHCEQTGLLYWAAGRGFPYTRQGEQDAEAALDSERAGRVPKARS